MKSRPTISHLRSCFVLLGACALAIGSISCVGKSSTSIVPSAPTAMNRQTPAPTAQPSAPSHPARTTAAPAPAHSGTAGNVGGSGDGRVITLTAANFDATINRPGAVVLVDFAADWCGPCRQLAPTIDRIASQFSGQVIVARIDVDHDEALANRYGVEVLPTLMYFKNGQAQRTAVGLTSEQAIAAELRTLLP